MRIRSTQAMFEFQRMLRQVSDDLKLIRPGKFWELWIAGDDFGMSEAEIAKLDREYAMADSYYHASNQIGIIQIDPNGAIRSFEFGEEYRGLPILAQFLKFLATLPASGHVIDFYPDFRSRGEKIEVDVMAVEDNPRWDADTQDYVSSIRRWRVGTFLYDPAQNLLLHRA